LAWFGHGFGWFRHASGLVEARFLCGFNLACVWFVFEFRLALPWFSLVLGILLFGLQLV
jgi:hypothetical protein